MHDAWVRLVLFQQLHHSEAVHANPAKLQRSILKKLGDRAACDPIARMMQLAREQQLEREARAS